MPEAVRPHFPPAWVPPVKRPKLPNTPDGKIDEQNEEQAGDNGDEGGQARDGGHLAAQGPRADIPPLGPVGANVRVVGWCESLDCVGVWDARLGL